MNWITRERPKIDRLACPWLIRKFIDPRAKFHYVPFDKVLVRAKKLKAIPYDIPNVKFTHEGDDCSFDALIREYKIRDKAVLIMAPIVRGADTDRHELSRESAGLWAISAGLAQNITDDQELLKIGFLIYEGLYTWARDLQKIKHTKQPFEELLARALGNISRLESKKKKQAPKWALELKEIIQDHVDESLNLKEISKGLDIHPSYLSREFSRYFGNLSFGEYIRKQRIERAKELMRNPAYNLTQIAYLSGFSDQSHFTRIFKKLAGQNPGSFRKKILKT